MKKRKSTEIQILEPTAYWERKLDINYDTEFIRYKKLCMKKLRKKEKHRLNGVYYITYTAWEQTMLDTIASLDEFELYEYIHFLSGRTNNRNIVLTLTSGYIVPFIIGIFCPYITTFLAESITTKNAALFFASIGLLLLFIKKLLNILWEALDDSLVRSFYGDLLRIVKSHYENIMERQRIKHA